MVGTNRVPSEAEATEIRFALHDLRCRMALLTNVEGSGSPVRQSQAQLQHKIADLSALLSASRKLAPELVAYIFELCLPKGGSTHTLRTYEAPLLVSQICQGWRNVALSTCTLWNSLTISLPIHRLPPSLWVAAITQASLSSLFWLSRAGNLKLHISVSFIHSEESNKLSHTWLPAATELIAQLLLRHGQQIKHLSFVLPVPCIFPLLRTNCASLKRLIIIDDGAWRPLINGRRIRTADSTVYIGVGSATQLHDMIITTPELNLRKTNLPWHQLTHLTIREPTCLPDCLTLLRICQQLHTFKFSVGPPMGTPCETRLVVSSIRELGVYGQPAESSALLQAITVPNLKKLIVGDGYDYPTLLFFLQELSRPLLSLSFKNIYDMSEQDFLDFLQLVPSLRELFAVSTFHNAVLEMLIPEDDFEPLCPLLESLDLRFHLANDELIELIEGRWGPAFRSQGIAQLKKARITFMSSGLRHETWKWDDIAWQRRVVEWRKQGMDLIVDDFDMPEEWEGISTEGDGNQA